MRLLDGESPGREEKGGARLLDEDSGRSVRRSEGGRHTPAGRSTAKPPMHPPTIRARNPPKGKGLCVPPGPRPGKETATTKGKTDVARVMGRESEGGKKKEGR